MVLGVPSNDFGGQEPDGKSEILQTAQGDYHVTFPLSEKGAVKGADAHPSTNGRRRSARSTRRAGISTNT